MYILLQDLQLSVSNNTGISGVNQYGSTENVFLEECEKCLDLEEELKSLKLSFQNSGKVTSLKHVH